MSTPASTRETIVALLDSLPDESLPLVEQFVRSLNERPPQSGKPAYPLVTVPASSLVGWNKVLKEGYPGDAFEDTESLTDDY